MKLKYLIAAAAALATSALVYAIYQAQQNDEKRLKEQMLKNHLINYH